MAKMEEKLSVPKIESAMDFWTVREKHRREFMATIPGIGELMAVSDYVYRNYIAL